MIEGLRLGVDFGTSSTKVALKLPNRAPVPLPIGDDQTTPYMPSVVTFPASPAAGDVLVAEHAARAAEAGTTVRAVKRCLGCQGDPCDPSRCASLPWCDGSGLIRARADLRVKPEDVMRTIVLEAVRRAREAALQRFGVSLDQLEGVGMGCGACFDHHQRSLLMDVAREAFGEHVPISLIDEPIATAMAYGNLSGIPPGRVLICDYGGGTFDTALLDVEGSGPGRFTLLAADGVRWLGGDDIDLLVYERFLDAMSRQSTIPVTDHGDNLAPLERQSIRSLSTQAKESLSSEEVFDTALFSESYGIVSLDLSREDLEQMVRSERRFEGCTFVERSRYCMLGTVMVTEVFRQARDARLLDGDLARSMNFATMGNAVDSVVMVGGVTRMPLVRQGIAQSFGADKIIDQQVLDPICAVAIGAAYRPPSDHFSILHPPYSIRVEFRNKQGQCLEQVELHAAGNKLDYLGRWPTNTLPVFQMPCQSVSRRYSLPFLVFAADGKILGEAPLPALDSTTIYATIDLAGRVMVNNKVTPERFHARVPLRHRWQEDIARAEEARAQAAKEDRIGKTRSTEHTMGTEN